MVKRGGSEECVRLTKLNAINSFEYPRQACGAVAAQGTDSYRGGSYCGDGLIVYGFMTVKCKRAAEQTLKEK